MLCLWWLMVILWNYSGLNNILIPHLFVFYLLLFNHIMSTWFPIIFIIKGSNNTLIILYFMSLFCTMFPSPSFVDSFQSFVFWTGHLPLKTPTWIVHHCWKLAKHLMPYENLSTFYAKVTLVHSTKPFYMHVEDKLLHCFHQLLQTSDPILHLFHVIVRVLAKAYYSTFPKSRFQLLWKGSCWQREVYFVRNCIYLQWWHE